MVTWIGPILDWMMIRSGAVAVLDKLAADKVTLGVSTIVGVPEITPVE